MDPIWYANKVKQQSLINDSLLTNVTKMTARVLPPLEAFSPPFQWILVCLFSCTAIVSFVGNIIVILVLIYGKKSSQELKKFLINLSLSDVFMSVLSIPFTYTDFMFGRWIFTAWMCPLANTTSTLAMCVSVYTLIIIGIDRYNAILHPLIRSNYIENHGILTLLVIWFVGATLSCPILLITRVEPFKYQNQWFFDCRENWESFGGDVTAEIYSTLLFVFTFSLPLIALVFVYGSIGCTILKSKLPGNVTEQRSLFSRNMYNTKAIKMMAMVVILFVICWTPIQIFNIIIWIFGKFIKTRSKLQMDVYVSTFFLCHWLAMAHSLVNPFIYCFMSDNFRCDLTSLWRRCRKLSFSSRIRSSVKRRRSSNYDTSVQMFNL